MPKTILELSKELGVSKTAISKLLTPENRKLYVSKKGNRLSINDEGVNLIRAHFNGDTANQSANNENFATSNANNANRSANSVGDLNQELVDALRAELAEKNRQLAVKDEQISTVHTLLDQQQKLTLQANQQISKLETQVKQLQLAQPNETTVDADIEDNSQTETQTSTTEPQITKTEMQTLQTRADNPKPKRHWWQFRRKKA